MKTPEYKVPLAGSERSALPGFRVERPANPSGIVDISVVLKPRADDRLTESIAEMTSRPPQERHYLTREQYAAAYGADARHLRMLQQFAARHELRILSTNEAARNVPLRGTAAAVSQAFGVNLNVYQHVGPHGVQRYRGRTGPIYIPVEFEQVVEAITGLDTRPQARPHLRRRRQFGGGWPHAGAVSYSPDHLARHYNFPTGVTGEGQCIGIIALHGSYSTLDLRIYFERLGLPVPKITSVSVQAAKNSPPFDLAEASGEVACGIQVVGAVAPSAHIVVYLAPATASGVFQAVTRAIHDGIHKPSIISIGWGSAEAAWTAQSMQILDQAFQAAAAMGITVCCAAGDRGSGDGNPGRLAHATFPASSPYVLACGGTGFTAIGDETVWNDGPGGGAGGGGVSDFFPLPPWQRTAGVPLSINPNRHMGRGLPDVAANAGPLTGYQVRINRRDTVIGGTGAGCLLWSALIALLNQKLATSMGYLNPLLYERAAVAGFTEITTGDNDLTGRVGAYQAGPGWNACTGLGTPQGVGLTNALLVAAQP